MVYYYVRIVDLSNYLIVKYTFLETALEVASWVQENIPTEMGYELNIVMTDGKFE